MWALPSSGNHERIDGELVTRVRGMARARASDFVLRRPTQAEDSQERHGSLGQVLLMHTPVQQTPLWEYFDDSAGEVVVDVLSDLDARTHWEAYFGAGSRSYFDLSDSSWVVSGKKIEIGRWLEDLNSLNFEGFRHKLNSTVPWAPYQTVFFCPSYRTTLKCEWSQFLEHWPAFLYLESDTPLLVADRKARQCVMFNAIGDAYLVDSEA